MFKTFLTSLLALLSAASFAAVDINKATPADLDSIKGIGPGTSAKIVEQRKVAKFKDWDDLVQSFNDTYARVYADAARSPELGYGITGAIMRGSVETKKPNIPEEPEAGPTPPPESRQGSLHPPYRHSQRSVSRGSALQSPEIS